MTITLDPRTPTVQQSDGRRPIRIVGAVLVAVAAALVALSFVGTGGTVDDSHQLAETQRMQALAPAPAVDVSSETAELRRFQSLAPQTDTSHEIAEAQRMQTLAPVIDTSSETAELNRMLALQP